MELWKHRASSTLASGKAARWVSLWRVGRCYLGEENVSGGRNLVVSKSCITGACRRCRKDLGAPPMCCTRDMGLSASSCGGFPGRRSHRYWKLALRLCCASGRACCFLNVGSKAAAQPAPPPPAPAPGAAHCRVAEGRPSRSCGLEICSGPFL